MTDSKIIPANPLINNYTPETVCFIKWIMAGGPETTEYVSSDDSWIIETPAGPVRAKAGDTVVRGDDHKLHVKAA